MTPLQAMAVSDTPVIVSSINPVHALVSDVLQGIAQPHLLMPADASPHHYVLKPSEARLLQQASRVFRIGPSLEGQLDRVIKTFGLTDISVNLIEQTAPGKDDAESARHFGQAHRGMGLDPHIWLDPMLAIEMVGAIEQHVTELFPNHTGDIADNTVNLINTIKETDAEIFRALSALSETTFVVWHDALAYFSEHYGLKIIGAVTDNHDVPPSAGELRTLMQDLEQESRVCLLTEAGSNEKAQSLFEGTSVKTLEIDILGIAGKDGPVTYPQLMRGLARVLQSC